MNIKRKQILVIATLILVAFTTSLTAQAGVMDWFTTNHAQTEQAKNGSFDALYAAVMSDMYANDEHPAMIASALVPATSPVGGSAKTIRKNYLVEVSAYTSEVAQCDSTPFITANGSHVRDGIVASNMFPFGTILKIPSLYGDKIFVVEDRMNTRYQKNVDIWFTDKAEARKLGRRLVQIEVIK